MKGWDWLWVAVGAGVAAPVRYWAGALWKPTTAHPFPRGTFGVNMLACLLLGIAAEMRLQLGWVQALVATGVCGALSTWSTLAWEASGLALMRRALVGALYLGASVVAGVLLAWAGNAIGSQFW